MVVVVVCGVGTKFSVQLCPKLNNSSLVARFNSESPSKSKACAFQAVKYIDYISLFVSKICFGFGTKSAESLL